MSHRIVLACAFACVLWAGCQKTVAVKPPGGGSEAGSGALDLLDPRVPVPLLPMMANHQKQSMRDHLEAVQAIVLALSADDFAAIERATRRIGYSEAMGQMCQHMGAGAPGFSEQALKFHHTADTIAVAARKGSRAGVLDALAATLQTCAACHATFKQRVVDEAAFAALTSQRPPLGHGPTPR